MSYHIIVFVILFFAACNTFLVKAIPNLSNTSTPRWTVKYEDMPPWGNVFYGGSPQGVAAIPGTPSQLVFAGKHILRRAAVSVNSSTNKATFTSLVYNDKAVPSFLAQKGYEHLGDSAVHASSGIIISPFERQPSYINPALAFHDLQTLKFINYTVAPNQHHCPWVAVEPVTNSVLSSEYSNVTEVYLYSFPELQERNFKIKLVPPSSNPKLLGENGLMSVQGGVVKNNILYLTTDQRVNPASGYDLFAFNLSGIGEFANRTIQHRKQMGQEPQSSSYFEANFIFGQNIVVERIKDLYSEMEGITIDDDNRMWIVTNLIDVAPYLLMLEN